MKSYCFTNGLRRSWNDMLMKGWFPVVITDGETLMYPVSVGRYGKTINIDTIDKAHATVSATGCYKISYIVLKLQQLYDYVAAMKDCTTMLINGKQINKIVSIYLPKSNKNSRLLKICYIEIKWANE